MHLVFSLTLMSGLTNVTVDCVTNPPLANFSDNRVKENAVNFEMELDIKKEHNHLATI